MIVKVKQKNEIAKDALYLSFDLLDQDLPFQAGQFFTLTLINPKFTDERGNSRYFGFVNSPTEKSTAAMLTRKGISAFKKSLLELQIGSEVDIDKVNGKEILPPDSSRPLVFIAGGVGIAPIMSIIRFIKEKTLAYKITLILTNKDIESAPFLEELSQVAKENNNFTFSPIMLHDNSWTGEKRRIDSLFIKETFLNINDSTYYVTGTQKFVLPVFKALKEAGVEQKNMDFEIFTGY